MGPNWSQWWRNWGIEPDKPCRDQDHSEDLFNTPARPKYLKSQQAELSHIVDILNRLSLAHPEIAFTLISDGKEMTRNKAGTGTWQAIAGAPGPVC